MRESVLNINIDWKRFHSDYEVVNRKTSTVRTYKDVYMCYDGNYVDNCHGICFQRKPFLFPQ